MYRLKFRPNNRCSKQRGELVPVNIWGLKEAVDTVLSYFIGIVTFLVLIDGDVLEGYGEQIGENP